MRRSNLYLFLLILSITIFPVPVFAQQEDDELTKRRVISESKQHLVNRSDIRNIALSSSEISEALDIPATALLESSLSGPAQAAAILPALGIIQALQGESFLLLSSGVVGTNLPEPGTDFAPEGIISDRVTLSLNLKIPTGINQLSFSYNYLSAEYPDYIGSPYNDTFLATIQDSNGIREIARASVNSSTFAPAAATNAGGSGFDIFTPDPSGVDTEFGTGLPDAGVTGFRTANIPVPENETVILTFLVEDRGDGILDSLVILDNLLLSSIEIVDPNPIFLSDGKLINDAETLSRGGRLVEGAVADGVTKVLLRNFVSGPSTVEFCINEGNPEDNGGFVTPDSDERLECFSTESEETSQGFIAYATYLAPEDFNRGGDDLFTSRQIQFNLRYSPNSGNEITTNVPFRLERPPVMLIHGLWSEGSTWDFSLLQDSRFSVTIADYRLTNASRFSANQFVPFNYIREAIVKKKLDNVAVTQVDIAGHSMGGLLSRIHTTLSEYEMNTNFNKGDVNKLITLNTPHTGSPLANVLVDLRDNLPIVDRILFVAAARAAGKPVDEGAADDLAKGSDAINSIKQAPIPSHALVGLGGSDALALGSPLYTIINYFADDVELFQNIQHDLIVGRQSQEGGLPTNAYTTFNGSESIHTAVTANPEYSDKIIQLLNSSVDGARFAKFPAPNRIDLNTAAVSSIKTSDPIRTQMIQAGLILTVSNPTPEGAVQVMVGADTGISVTKVLLTGLDVALVDDSAPFEFNVDLPIEVVGDYAFSAIGNDQDGNSYSSNEVTIRIEPTAQIESLSIFPNEPIISEAGDSRRLTVWGSYVDDINRNITDSSAGTVYLTSDPNIVSVSEDGVLTAVRGGVVTIVAQKGAIQDSISVRVLLDNVIPTANAGTDIATSIGEPVTLDGSASTDPDNGPSILAYEWFQIAGPLATLDNASLAQPTFTPFEAGRYVFSLIVRDGQADSATDRVVVDVDITDVQVKYSSNQELAYPEQPFTYTLTYKNEGAISASDIVVNVQLPSEVEVVESSVEYTELGEVRIFEVGNTVPGATGTITILGIVQEGLASGTTLTSTARITSTTLDANVLNNISTLSTRVGNVAPVASDSSLTVPEDDSVEVVFVTKDANSDSLTYTIVESPANGVLNENTETQGFVYTPNANFNGPDVFTYMVEDSKGASDSATVSISVISVNDPPIANDDSYTLQADETSATFEVLMNDSTIPDEGESLVIVSVTQPKSGAIVEISEDGKSLQYVRPTEFDGTDIVLYEVSDGELKSEPATVKIEVKKREVVLPETNSVYLPNVRR